MLRSVTRLSLLLPATLLPRLALADGSAGVGNGLDSALTTLLSVIFSFVVLGVGLFFFARRGQKQRRAQATPSRPTAPRPLRHAQPGLPQPLPYLLWFFAVVLAGFLLPLLLVEISSKRFGWWAYSFTIGFFYLCVLLVPPHFIALLYYFIRHLNRPYE